MPGSEPVRVFNIPLPLLGLALSAIGGVFGAGVTYATFVEHGQDLAKAQAQLQAQVNDHFAILEKSREQRLQIVNARIDSIAAIAAARADTNDHRDELRSDRLSAIDNRLNRLEAQVAYMVQLSGATVAKR